MKRFRSSNTDRDGAADRAQPVRAEPAFKSARKSGTESRAEKRAEPHAEKRAETHAEKRAESPPVNRSGTIEASPVPREAIGVIAPKKYHAVDDKELDGLRRLEKPLSLAMAAVFGGIFFGSALPASGTLQKLLNGSGSSSTHDMVLMIVCLISLGISIAAAFASAKSRTKLTGVIETIRKRSKVYLPPGHPLAPN